MTFSVARASPRVNELLRQMPSSEGEFTLRQIVNAAREDGEMATGEDLDIAQRDIMTVLQGDRLIGGALCVGGWHSILGHLARLSPRPRIRPGPNIPTSWMCSPQIRLLCQWLNAHVACDVRRANFYQCWCRPGLCAHTNRTRRP
jgi:hypothetical protein